MAVTAPARPARSRPPASLLLHDELEGVVDQTAALAATGGTAAQPWGGAGVVLWGFVCAGLG
ncbi:hypothetical protein, partial [Mycobacterium sp. NAZ190054]|uniref:hypothetical protein n=1 Tax=Mycobacterium sp. NAZ190054 TaxID=1747766 RepID=UPI000B21D621